MALAGCEPPKQHRDSPPLPSRSLAESSCLSRRTLAAQGPGPATGHFSTFSWPLWFEGRRWGGGGWCQHFGKVQYFVSVGCTGKLGVCWEGVGAKQTKQFGRHRPASRPA